MATIEELQSLYISGNYEQCLNDLDLFLLVNPKHTEANLLDAKCLFQIAYQHHMENEARPQEFKAAYHRFLEVIQLEPGCEEAMLFAAYIDVFFIQDNLEQSILFCDTLISSADENNRFNALDYRVQANMLDQRYDQALEDIDRVIDLITIRYKFDLVTLDQERSRCYLRKATIFLEYKKDLQQALKVYSESLDYIQGGSEIFYRIANLAFDAKEYELGGKAAIKAVYFVPNELLNDARALYDRINTLISQGIENKLMVYHQFILMRILDFDLIEILSLAKYYIKIYPDWAIPYHYAGAVLHDAKSYGEGYPYLKKSVEIGGGRIAGTRRYIEAAYRLTGQLPVIEQWPKDLSVEYYTAGVAFHEEMESGIRNAAIEQDLLKLRAQFYKVAYENYYNYFYNNSGLPENNDPHTFAMCCNNYGMALRALKLPEKAVEVHRVGYALSPFWEQLDNWGNALMDLDQYEEAMEVFNTALGYSSEYLGFGDYIGLKAGVLDATFKAGRKEEARILLSDIEEEYEEYVKEEGRNLSDEELFSLSERYIIVQNIRCDFLMEGTPEDAIKVWQEQLEKNPDDNSNWFMLMQNYYQVHDYPQCIACADNYQLIKRDTIRPESNLKVCFMKGSSYLKLGSYQKAKEDLSTALKILNTSFEAEMQSDLSKINFFLAECCFKLGEWKECLKFAWDMIECYNRNGWYWDEERIQATLYYADACKALGEKKAAIGTINTILEMKPENQEALKRKKEWGGGRLFSFLKKS